MFWRISSCLSWMKTTPSMPAFVRFNYSIALAPKSGNSNLLNLLFKHVKQEGCSSLIKWLDAKIELLFLSNAFSCQFVKRIFEMVWLPTGFSVNWIHICLANRQFNSAPYREIQVKFGSIDFRQRVFIVTSMMPSANWVTKSPIRFSKWKSCRHAL